MKSVLILMLMTISLVGAADFELPEKGKIGIPGKHVLRVEFKLNTIHNMYGEDLYLGSWINKTVQKDGNKFGSRIMNTNLALFGVKDLVSGEKFEGFVFPIGVIKIGNMTFRAYATSKELAISLKNKIK